MYLTEMMSTSLQKNYLIDWKPICRYCLDKYDHQYNIDSHYKRVTNLQV